MGAGERDWVLVVVVEGLGVGGLRGREEVVGLGLTEVEEGGGFDVVDVVVEVEVTAAGTGIIGAGGEAGGSAKTTRCLVVVVVGGGGGGMNRSVVEDA